MEKELNCINSKAIFDYVRAHNKGDVSGLLGDLDPEIDDLPDPEAFLTDPNNWISCTVGAKLYERARRILKDERAAFKIAKFAVETTTLGYTQGIIVKTFWSTKKGLKNLRKINEKWNRNKRIELVHLKKREAVIRLHWYPEMGSTKDFCLMNQGSYRYMPRVWGARPLDLEETCCFFEGGPYCEYRLTWSARNRFHEILSRFFTTKSVLMDTIKEMEEDKKVIEEKYEEVNRLNLELNQKIKQLTAIQETGKAILSILDLEELLEVIMNILSNVCKINRAIIMLVNPKERCLEYLYGAGFEGEVPEAIKNYKVPLDRLSNTLARVASVGRSEYIPEVRNSRLRKGNILLTYGNPESVYVVPLITRSRVIGVIATDAVEKGGVPEATRETLEIFAPQIAIAIENAKLYRRLSKQMEELRRSHALLSRAEKFSFLGNLSARLAHEIKNPMTAIGTFIQMLPHKYDDEEFRNNFYNIALEETARVNNLITELLDLVKTHEPHFQLEDLHDLINRMILLVSPQSNAKKIKVSTFFDPEVGRIWMDSEKMKQVILNLLSNAVEFTPEGGKIDVTTLKTRDGRSSEIVRIEIRDTGIGIPPENLEKVFDPYFTTKHKSSIHNGTGLGLFIAHKNMEDHKGSIEVDSKVNEGTVFTLSLPQNPSMSSSTLPPGRNHEAGFCKDL
ncbi:MAG: GAF domain-containing protein [Deltaproteobacteria bacterium]|nr:GAF domain-containing protein [Deltaproteobacteria bacterium]